MGVTDILNKAKKEIERIKKDRRYKKANNDRAAQAALTLEVTKCAGELGAGKSDLQHTIKTQCQNIRKGRKEGFDTTIQEKQLLDAAVGYMLIKDAQFAVQSISTYDSVENAYYMLDHATNALAGERAPLFGGGKPKHPKRSEYAEMNSDQQIQNKLTFAKSFMEELVYSGDIERCISEARERQRKQADSQPADTASSLPSSGTSPLRLIETENVTEDPSQLENIKKLKQEAAFKAAKPDV